MRPSPPTQAAAARESEEIVIRPPGAFQWIDVREVLSFRAALWAKTRKKVRLQFDDMWLGLFWSVARPLIMVLVFWAFKGISGARLGVEIPYVLYVYTGLVLWFYFNDATTNIATSVQKDAGVIQKVYFPRLLSPISTLLADTWNLALAALPLAVFVAAYGEYPGWMFLLLPVFLAQLMLLAFGLGLVFSTLVLLSRDWDRLLRFGLYVGFWLTPVIYSAEMLPEARRALLYANPVSGSLLAIRAALFEKVEMHWGAWLYSVGVSATLAVLGLLLFRRSECWLAERL